MRLAFVISDLDAGGAERVTSILASHWAEAGWTISIISQFGDASRRAFFALHPRVSVVRLDFEGIGRSSWPKTGKLRQLLALRRAILAARPDVVLSFMDTVNVRTLLATRGTGLPVVVSERCDPSVRPIGFSWEHLRRWLYPSAAAVVAQSREALAFFGPEICKRGHVIPNPVLGSQGSQGSIGSRGSLSSASERSVVVSLGRLHRVKGFDRLIEAFHMIAAKHPEWSLEIWGDGPAKVELAERIQRLGLEKRVFLRGKTDTPERELGRASLFVMSSHTEGFPMALGEAMASGLPVVAFDCPSGPRQLIRHDVDGWLVPNGDIPALASALDRLIAEPATRQRLGARASDVTSRFSLESVSRAWEDVLLRAARRESLEHPMAAVAQAGGAR